MFDYLLLLVSFVRAAVGDRAEIAVENLVLRQQLAVLSRPTRKRPRLRRCDKVFWVLVRRFWRECLDHLLIVNEAHLRAVLNEFVTFYNRDRPHQSLHLEPPLGPPPTVPFAAGSIRSRPVLGGLHHVYERAA